MQNNLLLFLILIFVSILLSYLLDGLLTDNMVISEGAKHLNFEQVENIINRKSSLRWYLLMPILISLWLIIKLVFITVALWIGFYLTNYEASYAQLFRAVVAAYFIVLIPDLLKVFWFTYVVTDYTLKNLLEFPVFFPSDMMLRNLQEPYSNILWPLKFYNLTNCFFCLAISYNLNSTKLNFNKTNQIVFSSCFLLLSLAVIFMVYISSLTL